MKFLFSAVFSFLLSLNSFATLGGETGNARSVPIEVEELGVRLELPENWSVETTPKSVKASNVFLMSDEFSSPASIKVSEAKKVNFQEHECALIEDEGIRKWRCGNLERGQVFILSSNLTLSVLDYRYGSHIDVNQAVERTIRSFGSIK